MSLDLKGQFFCATMRIKKTGASFSTGCDMHMNELAILQTIAGSCCCPQREGMNLDVPKIQEELQISKPAVSYILNTLEKKNYITRDIDPRDRRKIFITATPQGLAAAEESTRLHDRLWERLLAEFGEEDMRQLIGQMNRMTDLCEQICGEPPDKK